MREKLSETILPKCSMQDLLIASEWYSDVFSNVFNNFEKKF